MRQRASWWIFCVAAVAYGGAPARARGEEPVVPTLSPPLRDLSEALQQVGDKKRIVRNFALPRARKPAGSAPSDTVVQQGVTLTAPLATGVNFEGVPVFNSAPPDTNGRPGKNHYVQWVNTRLAVWDKSGNLLYGPVKGNTLFQPLGGTCATHNDGDPVVQYDLLADRWVLSQFAVFATDGFFSHLCVAVSQTGDPLGAYYLYDFPVGVTTFVDYPHMGVWPDAYWVTTHQFEPSGTSFSYGGQGLYAFDRERMLAGLPAPFQFVFLGSRFGGALPSDLDSLTPPPPGAPNYVVAPGGPVLDGSLDSVLHIWKVRATWGPSPSVTVEGPVDVVTAPFNDQVCTFSIPIGIALGGRPCVPEPPTATPLDYLDELSDRLMFRLAYRHFPQGTPLDPSPREVLVLNHTVNAGAFQAAVRWYELRDPGGTPQIHQQGTWAGPPGDLRHRWMGSIAMDNAGNILLGYSKSDASLFPEIGVAGRLATDPPGELGTELTMIVGLGSQLGTGNRWGDYSAMTVDAHDGCTFWYTNQYQPSTGSFNWRTRIASYRFPGCTPPPQARITGTVTDCATGAPLSRVTVETDGGFSAATDAQGRYEIVLPPGAYTLAAQAPARSCAPSPSSSVSVGAGATAVRDFCVSGSPRLQLLSASIDDSAGNGNGQVNRNECIQVSTTLVNEGCAAASGASAIVTTSTPNVTIDQPQTGYPTMAVDQQGSNLTPFSLTVGPGFACGTPIVLELRVSGGGPPQVFELSLPTCPAAPVARSGSLTASDPQQASRLGRDSSASACGTSKTCPGPLGTGTRAYDAYTFTNAASSAICATVTLSADPSCTGTNQVQSAAYQGAFNPNDLCSAYLADSGGSPDQGFNSYSFTVPAGSDFVVTVNAVQEGGTCAAYNLSVSGLVDSGSTGNGPCPPTGGAPPVARNDLATTFEGVPVRIPVFANDSDGGFPPLQMFSLGQPANGQATDNGDGTVTYTPRPGFHSFFAGPDTFNYRVVNGRGFTATARVDVDVKPLCDYTPAGDAFFDFEAGPAGWTVDTAADAGSVNWTIAPDPTPANLSNRSFFSDDPHLGPKDDRLVSPPFNLSPSSRLLFQHRFNTEDTFDGGVLEVSLDGGQTWRDIVAAGGRFLQGGYNSHATGFPNAWAGISDHYPENSTVEVDVSALAGNARLFRFRLTADTNLGAEGWHVDDVRVTNLLNVTNCRPAPPTVTCYEDDSPLIQYGSGWHHVAYPPASAGHFRLRTGDDDDDDDDDDNGRSVRLPFQVEPGKTGSLVYHYATSKKGGSAKIFLDGAARGTVSYKGASGSLRKPVMGSSLHIESLAPGSHVFELRSVKGGAYLDAVCLESASAATTPPTVPGPTEEDEDEIEASGSLVRTVSLDPAATMLSVAAEATPEVPLQVVVLDALNTVVGTALSVEGVAGLHVPVNGGGLYIVQVTNLSVGPVTVWTAVTPLLSR